MAQRVGGKGGNAGTSPVGPNLPTVANMSIDRAVKECVRIAKTQVRIDKDLEQRFQRPGDHLWEVANGNLTWRIRFDAMPFSEQQALIVDGKSRFCAGGKFEKQIFDFHNKPPIPLVYGGAHEFLISQDLHLSLHCRSQNETAWMLHNKIYIAGVLADEIEAAYPWSTWNKENLLQFKRVTGKSPECMDLWKRTLGVLLRQQGITLEKLMTAEVVNERKMFDRKTNIADIMRKPETALTAEDTKAIAARVTVDEAPSGSASYAGSSKWNKAAGNVREATPKAAPAVVHKIAKAHPERPPMPRRPTPPIDPPAKRPKAAAEQVPYGQRTGKGQGAKGRQGNFNDEYPGWYCELENQGFQHLPEPPPYVEPRHGAREYPVRHNAIRDVRETDRIRREREARGPNEAYDAWHETAWQGRSPFPRVDNRGYERDDHPRAEDRTRGTWTPSPPPPMNRVGRNRTRSPYGHRANNQVRRRNDGWEPSQDQYDWDENDWARRNEHSRRHKPGR